MLNRTGCLVPNYEAYKVRLTAAVHYNTQRLYIRHVLTHNEYDKKNGGKADVTGDKRHYPDLAGY